MFSVCGGLFVFISFGKQGKGLEKHFSGEGYLSPGPRSNVDPGAHMVEEVN